MVGGGWQWLAVGGWSPLAVGGGWWWLVVGVWWRLAVDGSWRLAVGGPLGRSLRAVLSKKKKSGPLRTALNTPDSKAQYLTAEPGMAMLATAEHHAQTKSTGL